MKANPSFFFLSRDMKQMQSLHANQAAFFFPSSRKLRLLLSLLMLLMMAIPAAVASCMHVHTSTPALGMRDHASRERERGSACLERGKSGSNTCSLRCVLSICRRELLLLLQLFFSCLLSFQLISQCDACHGMRHALAMTLMHLNQAGLNDCINAAAGEGGLSKRKCRSIGAPDETRRAREDE